MRLHIVAVGQHMPAWAQTACEDYARRFPPDLRLEIRTVKTEPRTSAKPVATLQAAEAQRIRATIASIGRHVRTVALDERGATVRTQALAQRLRHWQDEGDDVALLIGGPDGLDASLRESAHECIRLSDLTLPHALARVLLAEQLYRAWSILARHPYHRE